MDFLQNGAHCYCHTSDTFILRKKTKYIQNLLGYMRYFKDTK